jgi:hypothetical protein
MREYRVWKSAEESALRAGVLKHGTGAWEVIRTDPEFSQLLCVLVLAILLNCYGHIKQLNVTCGCTCL